MSHVRTSNFSLPTVPNIQRRQPIAPIEKFLIDDLDEAVNKI
jgi:hypothetical protein